MAEMLPGKSRPKITSERTIQKLWPGSWNRNAEGGYFYECRVILRVRIEGIVITLWPITDRSFAAGVPDTDHPPR